MSDYEMRMMMRELEGVGGALISSLIVPVIVAALSSAVLTYCIRWFIFRKAGEDGWKALVPFYSDYINYKIVWDGKMYLLLLVASVFQTVVSGIFTLIHPIVGMFFGIVLGTIVGGAKVVCELILQFKYARAFGKNDYFGVGMYFLNNVFTAILAFGEAKYKGVPDDGIGVPKFLENLGQRPVYNPNAYMPMQQPMPGQPMQQPMQPVYPVQPAQPMPVVVQPQPVQGGVGVPGEGFCQRGGGEKADEDQQCYEKVDDLAVHVHPSCVFCIFCNICSNFN